MNQHLQEFRSLTDLLVQYSAYWRCQPFLGEPEWVSRSPKLAQAIEAISDQRLYACQASDHSLLETFSVLLPELCAEIAERSKVATFSPIDCDLPAPEHIRPRKWQQVLHFAAVIENCNLPFIEWCSGKAHLGRTLYARSHQPVLALEKSAELVEAGQCLSNETGLRVQFQQCDVLSTSAKDWLSPKSHAVALHACGGLHRKLLTDSANSGVQQLSWSPCCYHKYLGGEFQPLSREGQQSGLSLSLQEIRGAVRQSTTAGQSELKQHRILQGWRLGFDALQRDLRGIDEYLSTPPAPKSTTQRSFRAFCETLAEAKQLKLPEGIDFESYEQTGIKRYAKVARQELLRELFRRPLELWIVLDEILFLEDHGYHCKLQTFCQPEITPRNLLIQATRC